MRRSIDRGKRIIGLDFSRSVAIYCMILINFRLIFDDRKAESNLLILVLEFIEGRAAALFIFISGVVFSYFAEKKTLNNSENDALINWLFVKRGVTLLFLGFGFSLIWPLDILHCYGFLMLTGAICYRLQFTSLLLLIITLFLTYLSMMLLMNYETLWLNNALPITELLYIPDLIRHYMYEGVYPMIPWAAVFLFGMLFGRGENLNIFSKKRTMLIVLIACIVLEITASILYKSHLKMKYFSISESESISLEYIDDEKKKWIYVRPFPPTPFFMLSSTATSILVVSLGMITADRCKEKKWFKHIVNGGQSPLTFYIAHVLLGIVPLRIIGFEDKMSYLIICLYGTLFFIAGIFLINEWSRRYGKGPVEQLFRIISNS